MKQSSILISFQYIKLSNFVLIVYNIGLFVLGENYQKDCAASGMW